MSAQWLLLQVFHPNAEHLTSIRAQRLRDGTSCRVPPGLATEAGTRPSAAANQDRHAGSCATLSPAFKT